VQDFTHPFFDGVSKIVGSLRHSKLDIVTDGLEPSFIVGARIVRVCVGIPFIAVSAPGFADIHLPDGGLFNSVLFLL
jgi:hypothetical protein